MDRIDVEWALLAIIALLVATLAVVLMIAASNRRIRRTLQVSERRLKWAQNLAKVGNWELEIAARRMWASEESFKMYGCDYDPVSPYLPLDTVQAAVFPEDRPAMDAALKSLIAQNEKYDVQFRITCQKTGETKYIHSESQLQRGPDGQPAKVLGVFREITETKLAEMALQASEVKNRTMIANIADVLAIMAPDGTMTYKSPNIEKWFGWKPEDLVGTDGWATVHPDDLGWIGKKFEALLAADYNTDTVQYRYKCKDGSYRVIELTAVNMVRDPVIGGVLMNYRDVTERNLAQLEYRALLQAALECFWLFDGAGRFLEVNDAYCKLSGYSRAELLGMTISDIEADMDQGAILDCIRHILAVGSARFETHHRCKDGSVVDIEVSCNAVLGEYGRIYAFLYDISERKKREKEILYMSHHDMLTGLYNRAFLDGELARLDAEDQLPLTVISGDINGLKLTNDVFGHSEGDKLLKEIARILRWCCQEQDIVARMGGDEFYIVMPEADGAAAQAVCDQIYRQCEQREIIIEGGSYHPSISLGYATKRTREQSMEGVLKDAEDFMYKRKLLEHKSMHSSLVSAIRTTLLEKSHETMEHADRLVSCSRAVGLRLGLGSDQLYELELLAALHDIGKIGVDDHILSSPKKLTQEEWVEMRKHPEIGYRIALASPELVTIADCILCHHERWDGTGYPQGFAGSKIPLLARILAVADAYDAMVNDRPYRRALPVEAAVTEIAHNSGLQFDPDVVKAFLETVSEL